MALRRILLTNDDGVGAEGLGTLSRHLQDAGFRVDVAAPEHERSASGHAITLHKPLHAEAATVRGLSGQAWAVSGTPADCVKLAVGGLLADPPDLVIAGINRGGNVGLDVLYSGTVSAAFEGVVLGIPALAVSLASFDADLDFAPAAEFATRLVRSLDEIPRGSSPFLLNVNVPPCRPAEIAGVAITRLGTRAYRDVVHPRQDPRGRVYYWLAGTVADAADEPGTDVWAVANRRISVTPLHLDLTDQDLRLRLEPWARGRFGAP